jgi:hypothetical protein
MKFDYIHHLGTLLGLALFALVVYGTWWLAGVIWALLT